MTSAEGRVGKFTAPVQGTLVRAPTSLASGGASTVFARDRERKQYHRRDSYDSDKRKRASGFVRRNGHRELAQSHQRSRTNSRRTRPRLGQESKLNGTASFDKTALSQASRCMRGRYWL